MSECAACGKTGVRLRACNACKEAKYCGVDCQRAHWRKHKKECGRRAAALRDEALFKTPPREECPVCLLTMPLGTDGETYQSCCGKTVCSSCIDEVANRKDIVLCPFCRAPPARSAAEFVERCERNAERNDPEAMCNLGIFYAYGGADLTQDVTKGIELLTRAAELGSQVACGKLGDAYSPQSTMGLDGVESDIKKTMHYYELAAMKGNVRARYNLGALEYNAENDDRAVKHWMIAAAAGDGRALEQIQRAFAEGDVAKDEFERALRAHKDAQDEMNSDVRAKYDSSPCRRGDRENCKCPWCKDRRGGFCQRKETFRQII